MPNQKLYRISYAYKNDKTGEPSQTIIGWCEDDDYNVWEGDTWQEAIRNWAEDWISYEVISETTYPKGGYGIMEIQVTNPGTSDQSINKVKATPIEHEI